jgi:hypothetical protein
MPAPIPKALHTTRYALGPLREGEVWSDDKAMSHAISALQEPPKKRENIPLCQRQSGMT